MDFLSDIREIVQQDLTVGAESSLYTPAIIDSGINRAYRKIGGLHRWPDLQDAKKTSTEPNTEYYDYPETWRPNSIWKLTIDDVDYGDPVAFKDYLTEKESNTLSSSSKLWANQWRRYFIYPTPTTHGSNNISVWGQDNVEKLVNDGDTTIFSYSQPEVNEAIALEAVQILKAKGGEQKEGLMLSAEARQIVAVSWDFIKREIAKYEKTQPFLDVPDFFSGRNNVKNTIGNF